MRPMNVILADIVVASGGAATNPNNRNQLLSDWRDAVTPGVTSYTFSFDGLTHSVILSQPFVFQTVFDVSVDFSWVVGDTRKMALMGSTAPANWFYVIIDPAQGKVAFRLIGQIVEVHLSALVTGMNTVRVTRDASNVVKLFVNSVATLSPIIQSGLAQLDGFAAWGNGSWGSDKFKGFMPRFSVDGVVHNINNKSLGANQVGATIINYNEAGWVQI